jgi:hypothetical protein
MGHLRLNRAVRLALVVAVCAALALPAFAAAKPATETPTTGVGLQAVPAEPQAQSAPQSEVSGRTLAIVLSGTALLVAVAGTAYSVRLAGRIRHTA